MTFIEANAGQREFWNSPHAQKWLLNADLLDAAMAELTERLLHLGDPKPGERVLDVGCGAGTTTLAMAERVGPTGRVLGLDISEVLAGQANRRLAAAGFANAEVVLADAQTEAVPETGFDLMVSRFGVMFFDDPAAAFRNLRAALRPGGRAVLAAWSGMAMNPWFSIPRAAAADRLGDVAPTPPREPGPMAFEDVGYFADLLTRAGFSDVTVDAAELDFRFAGPVREAGDLISSLGPAARIMREYNGTSEDAEAIAEATTAALAPYATDAGVSIPACLNIASARRP